jgi:hypothetical protein
MHADQGVSVDRDALIGIVQKAFYDLALHLRLEKRLLDPEASAKEYLEKLLVFGSERAVDTIVSLCRIDASLARQLGASIERNSRLKIAAQAVLDALPFGVRLSIDGEPIDHAKLNRAVEALRVVLRGGE